MAVSAILSAADSDSLALDGLEQDPENINTTESNNAPVLIMSPLRLAKAAAMAKRRSQ
jgi:hypothetical protein